MWCLQHQRKFLFKITSWAKPLEAKGEAASGLRWAILSSNNHFSFSIHPHRVKYKQNRKINNALVVVFRELPRTALNTNVVFRAFGIRFQGINTHRTIQTYKAMNCRHNNKNSPVTIFTYSKSISTIYPSKIYFKSLD